jgi:hypothetical protein
MTTETTTAREIAEAILRSECPLAKNDDTPVTLPLFKLLALIEQGVASGRALANPGGEG